MKVSAEDKQYAQSVDKKSPLIQQVNVKNQHTVKTLVGTTLYIKRHVRNGEKEKKSFPSNTQETSSLKHVR